MTPKLDKVRGATYNGAEVQFPIGRDRFRITLMRDGGRLPFDPWVESFNWQEADDGYLAGQINLIDLKPMTLPSFTIGDQFLCEYLTGGKWQEAWRLRVQSPGDGDTITRDLVTDGRAILLADDLLLLSRSTDDWKFTVGKAHPHGWHPHEVVRAVCRRYGVRIGALPRTRSRIRKMVHTNTSPLAMINLAMRFERTNRGSRFVMRFRNGKLYITPLVPDAVLLHLGPAITVGSQGLAQRQDYATTLTVRATTADTKGKDGKGRTTKKHRKIVVGVTKAAFLRRYGHVHGVVNIKGVHSTAQARKLGLVELNKRMRATRTVSFTHPGIVGVRRGQAIRLRIPSAGLTMIAFVSTVTHSVTAGDYTMDVTVQFSDPLAATKADKVAAAKVAAAARRARKGGSAKRATPPRPKGAAQRSSKAAS